LEFSRLRKDLWGTQNRCIDYMNLIFDATLGGVNVLAKVVTRSYGVGVHAHLAAQRMAPQLLPLSPLFGLPPPKLARRISHSNQKLLLRCNLNHKSKIYVEGSVLLFSVSVELFTPPKVWMCATTCELKSTGSGLQPCMITLQGESEGRVMLALCQPSLLLVAPWT
jgi:hypothetical protein